MWAVGRPWTPTQAFGIFLRIPGQDSAPFTHLRMSEYHSYGLHYATVIACLNHFVQMYDAPHRVQVKSQITEFPCLFCRLFASAWHLLSPTKTLCRNTNPRTGMLPRPVKPILPLLIIFFSVVDVPSSLALDSSMATFSVRQGWHRIPSCVHWPYD